MSAPAIFETELPKHELTIADLFDFIMKTTAGEGARSLHLAISYVRLATGPGKISPDDFIRLRLYDESFLAGADPRAFIGAARHRLICGASNYLNDWIGMMSNKIASGSYLAAHGLPVIPFEKIFLPGVPKVGNEVAGDASSLGEFLQSATYPLFGKPSDGQNSLGSISLERYDISDNTVVTNRGDKIRIEDLIAAISSAYPSGYIFQKRAKPHPEIARLCGDRLATVRFMTIRDESGARILRAVWKIPAGINGADNYWRPGNLLAKVDLESGRVERAVSGSGLDMQEHSTHPDTGIPLIGFVHPQWDAMRSLALKGAALLPRFPLIGWDIACTDVGPVVVELNLHPDSFLMQFADRRGLLDDDFNRFIVAKTGSRTVR